MKKFLLLNFWGFLQYSIMLNYTYSIMLHIMHVHSTMLYASIGIMLQCQD